MLNGNSIKVCIVDDEPGLGELYAEQLKGRYQVRCFLSAEEALAEFDREYAPDVYVTDIKMPGMSGLEFSAKLRERDVNKPIIAISGYAEKEHAIQAMQQNVSALLEKPFSAKKLEEQIDRAVASEKKRAIQERLIAKYQTLTDVMMHLMRRYEDRYARAENLLVNANVAQTKDQNETAQFLENIKAETQLEMQIETLTNEIRQINQSIRVRA